MAKLGESDYRAGGRERLEEAFILLSAGRFGGCVYMAGRAVEGMLRAVIWNSDPDYVTGRKSLETGHNLRDMLDLVGRLGVLHDNPLRDEISANILHVGRLWWNDMRFISEQKIKSKWFELQEIGGKRTLKHAAREYYNACSLVIRHCEALWQS